MDSGVPMLGSVKSMTGVDWVTRKLIMAASKEIFYYG